MKELSLLAREGRNAPATGSAGFANKRFAHAACFSCEVVIRANWLLTDRSLQSPAPAFGEKYWSLFGFPSHSLLAGGGAFLTLIFGQILAYSAFSDSHFSSP